MRRGVQGSLLSALALLPSLLLAQDAPPATDAVPSYERFTIASRALAEERAVNVHVPARYLTAPSARFPVLFMLDGGLDEDFPHVVNTVDSLIALGRIRPVIVVGIPNTVRRRDLTGPTRYLSDSAMAPQVSGSSAFRRFVREELIPAVEKRYRVTPERALVGESLAGLFVVETMLAEPRLFTHYIAFDPSLWWNRGALVDSASARLAGLDLSTRTLYLSSSSQDIDHNTTRLATLLQASTSRRFQQTFALREDLTHATLFRGEGPTALARALR